MDDQIVIVDVGAGNAGSLKNMLRKIGAQVEISSSPSIIEAADKLILPGVGAFGHVMNNLSTQGLIPALNNAVLEMQKPVLGVCLGMQLLGKRSEEGSCEGLGWIEARTVKLNFSAEENTRKIPHMGWNALTPIKEHPLLRGLDQSAMFYFVHSYHVHCVQQEDIIAKTEYGIDFTSVIARGNIMGVQFHPEKSLRYGMKLLENFWRGDFA